MIEIVLLPLAVMILLLAMFLIAISIIRALNKPDEALNLGLKEFKTIYEANPDAIYGEPSLVDCIDYCSGPKAISIYLSLPALVWYMVARHLKNRRTKKSIDDANLEFILRDCQKNIDKRLAEAQTQIEEAKDLNDKALQNLKKGSDKP